MTRVARRRSWLLSLPLVAGACGVRVVDPGARPTVAPPDSDESVTRIDALGAHARWKDGRAVLVDTRARDAFVAGRISGAISMPLADVERDGAGARRRIPAGMLAIFYCT
jgi:hypothetical protein